MARPQARRPPLDAGSPRPGRAWRAGAPRDRYSASMGALASSSRSTSAATSPAPAPLPSSWPPAAPCGRVSARGAGARLSFWRPPRPRPPCNEKQGNDGRTQGAPPQSGAAGGPAGARGRRKGARAGAPAHRRTGQARSARRPRGPPRAARPQAARRAGSPSVAAPARRSDRGLIPDLRGLRGRGDSREDALAARGVRRVRRVRRTDGPVRPERTRWLAGDPVCGTGAPGGRPRPRPGQQRQGGGRARLLVEQVAREDGDVQQEEPRAALDQRERLVGHAHKRVPAQHVRQACRPCAQCLRHTPSTARWRAMRTKVCPRSMSVRPAARALPATQ